jgi:hypothetical protein
MTKGNKETKLFKCRDWLNKDEGIALIESHVRINRRSKHQSFDLDASLTIGDCSRQITLDFDFYMYDSDSKATRHRNIRLLKEKVGRMRKYVGGFMAAMDEAIVEAETAVKNTKVQKRKKK